MTLSRARIVIIFVSLQAASALHAQTTYEPYYFNLLAGGTGVLGSSDGSGNAARFNAPQGAAVDSSGNAYIADTGNNTIRKISPGGAVTTFAGFAGSAGSADGTGSAARFELPQGIAVDGGGNVYVADSGNYTIRKITPAGVVTTLAGAAHQVGSIDGAGAIARFGYPIGVSVDASGNIYVGDNGNNTIRMITVGGVVSTLAGLAGSPGSTDGTGTVARFNVLTRVAFDNKTGVIYVADTGNNTIRRVTTAGVVTTVAGLAGSAGTSDGNGTSARFDGPRGVSVDGSSNIYVASTNSHTIRKIAPSGAVTTLAGTPATAGSADGVSSSARFNFPYALAADLAGHLYVADTINQTVRFGLPAGEVLSLMIAPGLNGQKMLTGRAFPNVVVNIVATGDLATSFQPLTSVMADANGFFHYEDTSSIKRFYRASIFGG